MKKPLQGYCLRLLEEEKNLLGMLLDDVSVPGKYAETYIAIRDRYNAMKPEKIGTVVQTKAPAKTPTASKAHASVVAKKRTRKKKKR